MILVLFFICCFSMRFWSHFIEFPMISPDYKKKIEKRNIENKDNFLRKFCKSVAKLPRSIRESLTSADKSMGLRNNMSLSSSDL